MSFTVLDIHNFRNREDKPLVETECGPDAPEDIDADGEIPLPWTAGDWAATICVACFLGVLAWSGAIALGWIK